jgi:hypothetical protein
VRSSTSTALSSTRQNATPRLWALRIGPGQSKQTFRASRKSNFVDLRFTASVSGRRHQFLSAALLKILSGISVYGDRISVCVFLLSVWVQKKCWVESCSTISSTKLGADFKTHYH